MTGLFPPRAIRYLGAPQDELPPAHPLPPTPASCPEHLRSPRRLTAPIELAAQARTYRLWLAHNRRAR